MDREGLRCGLRGDGLRLRREYVFLTLVYTEEGDSREEGGDGGNRVKPVRRKAAGRQSEPGLGG